MSTIAQTKKVPKLRFPQFRDDWSIDHFSHYLDSVSSGKSSTVSEDIGKYLIYGSTNIIGESDTYDYSGDKILIARVGANAGSIYRVEGRYKVSDNTLIVELKDTISTVFTYYLLSGANLKKFVFGSGQPLLTGGQLKKIKIAVPIQAEQEIIADFMEMVDKRITANEKNLISLRKYKKSVIEKIYTQQIRFKAEDKVNYPGWEMLQFGAVYKFLKTNSYSRAELETDGIIKNIHYGDIHTRLSASFDSSKERLSFVHEPVRVDLCKTGDLVIADASEDRKDVGKAIEIIQINSDKIVSGLHTFLARPINDNLSVGFGAYLMQSSAVRRQIMRIANGASVLGISKRELSKIMLTVPCKQEQQKIADYLASLDAKINLVEAETARARVFRKALLQRLFV